MHQLHYYYFCWPGALGVCDRPLEPGGLVHQWLFHLLDHPEVHLLLHGLQGDCCRTGSLHQEVVAEDVNPLYWNIIFSGKTGTPTIHSSYRRACLVRGWFLVTWKLSKSCQSTPTWDRFKYPSVGWSWTSWNGFVWVSEVKTEEWQ